MDIITTHINADFDALACLLAAKKLYPKARIVLPGLPEQAVREFLTLHRYILKIDKEKDIDFSKVTRLIVVDTRTSRRIGNLRKLVEKNTKRSYYQLSLLLWCHIPNQLHQSCHMYRRLRLPLLLTGQGR